jgi:L-cystine transport system permease protein
MAYYGKIDGKQCIFTGDSVFAAGQVLLQSLHDVRIPPYRIAVKRLAELEVDAIFPAHGIFCLSNGGDHIKVASAKCGFREIRGRTGASAAFLFRVNMRVCWSDMYEKSPEGARRLMNKYFDVSKIPSLMSTAMTAFPVTIKLVLLSLLFGLLVGLLVACMALAKSRFMNAAAKFYIAFMRGMPLLVLIFILYFVMPLYLRNVGVKANRWSKDSFVIAALALSSAANLAEMMRSSFLSVDRYQWEAAYSVGMGSFAAFRRIVLPQAFGVAIPVLGNNIIGIFKGTSLAFSIGAVDIFGKAKLISANLYGLNRAELYLGICVIFWVVCLLLEQVTKRVEHLYTKGKKIPAA